ncbi:MAG: hypothetical protein IT258_13850 [Saprospiraceae bacterium]|nr:hypothetical protein [Saprospiraceae bacterium]
MKLKNRTEIEAWLEAGDLEQVLDELIAQLKTSKSGGDFLKTAISLSSQLEKLREDKLKGVLTYEQETVTFNKLHEKVQILIESIEKDKPKPTPLPKPAAQEKPAANFPITHAPEKKTNWLWFVGIPILAFGVWWALFRGPQPIKSTIRICTRDQFSAQNWCDHDMARLSIVEAVLHHPMVSAAFEGRDEADPSIQGTVTNSNGDVFPTQRIQLTMSDGGLGYAAEIQPVEGIRWELGIYTIKLTYNGEPAGEKQFEVFNDRQFLQQN